MEDHIHLKEAGRNSISHNEKKADTGGWRKTEHAREFL